MNANVPFVCGAAAFVLALAGCGGATFSGAPGPEKDAGPSDSAADRRFPSFDGGTCEIYRIIPPMLIVTDQRTGAPICAVTVTGAAQQASLAPCTDTGCPKTCAYDVDSLGGSSTSFSVTITATGYGTTTVTGLMQGGCGCDTECPAPQQVSATLIPVVSPPPPVDGGLLPGVHRRHILANHPNAEERVLSLDDLREADAIYLSNAVRGLRRAVIHWDSAC